MGSCSPTFADGQYEFCGPATEGKAVYKNIEKTTKTKGEIGAALKEAFAYCDAAYASLTDAKAAETVKFFDMTVTRLGAMDFNTAHNMEDLRQPRHVHATSISCRHLVHPGHRLRYDQEVIVYLLG